jgi:hypothetical protein
MQQYIQETCLMNLLITSLFVGNKEKPFRFSWDRIGSHSAEFCTDYDYEDAQFLLQLSLMITLANFEGRSLNPPPWLHDIELTYMNCPIKLGSNRAPVPDSAENKQMLELSSMGLIATKLLPMASLMVELSSIGLVDIKIEEGHQTNSIIKSFNKELDKATGTKSVNNTLGHVLYNEAANLVFIMFTGTSNACMAILDLEYPQVPIDEIRNYVPGMQAHQGIYGAYKVIREQLVQVLSKFNQPRMIISGHSLGGALSQLCALDFAAIHPTHYTFAAPMIFNPTAAAIFDELVPNSYRVANLSDLVVLSPLPIMPNKDVFSHVGHLIHFQSNLGTYPLNHTAAYVREYELA